MPALARHRTPLKRRCTKVLAHPLGKAHGALSGAVAQDRDELLAAEPGGQVHAPGIALEDLGKAPERGIAGIVSVAVIDPLEVVQIE